MDKKKITLVNYLGTSWYNKLGHLFDEQFMKDVSMRVRERRKTFNVEVYPEANKTFNAFKYTQFEDVKVIIIGQDPYNIPGVADGLAFSSQDPFTCPTALSTIKKEIENSVYDGLNLVFENDLTRWAIQGVFLLNTLLTVEKDKTLAHEKFGWQEFTSIAIQKLFEDPTPKVFMLWGMGAKTTFNSVLQNITDKDNLKNHLILEATHPQSSGGEFIGCNHFVKANDFLTEKRLTTIEW